MPRVKKARWWERRGLASCCLAENAMDDALNAEIHRFHWKYYVNASFGWKHLQLVARQQQVDGQTWVV